MDMTKSQGNNAPFLGNITSTGVVQTSFNQDGNYAENGHAFVMVFAMLIIIPLGIIMVRSLERVNLHIIFQSIGVGLVLLGLISGIAISLYYNRVRFPSPSPPQFTIPLTNPLQSRSFRSAHQILGLFVVIALLSQWLVGFLHHRTHKLNQVGHPALLKAHKLFLGPIAFALGLLNASLGFRLAMAYILNWVYIGCVFLVAIILFVTAWKREWFRRKWGRKQPPNHFGASPSAGPPPPAYGAGAAGAGLGAGLGASAGEGPYGSRNDRYDSSPFGTRSDIALANMGDPPSYSQPPTRPREFA
jgi:cytochrome b561-like protein